MTEFQLAEAVFSKLAEDTDFIPDSEKSEISKSKNFVFSFLSSFVDAKIAEVYQKVGYLMSRYKSGKIPKAFKVIPTLKNWEDVLALTAPQNWTPNAMLEATKIFASNLPPKIVET